MAIALEMIAPAGAVELSFRRLFAAPRAQVWAAWTEAARFSQWFGPHGSAIDPCEVDARVGGQLFFRHIHTDHPEVWVRGTYVEVVPGERLVFIVGFSGPDGGSHPRDGFAELSRIEITLRDHDTGTEMRIRHSGLRSDQGEGAGWREGLERLQSLLSIQDA